MKFSFYNIINKFLPYFTIITTKNLQIFIIIMMCFLSHFSTFLHNHLFIIPLPHLYCTFVAFHSHFSIVNFIIIYLLLLFWLQLLCYYFDCLFIPHHHCQNIFFYFFASTKYFNLFLYFDSLHILQVHQFVIVNDGKFKIIGLCKKHVCNGKCERKMERQRNCKSLSFA